MLAKAANDLLMPFFYSLPLIGQTGFRGLGISLIYLSHLAVGHGTAPAPSLEMTIFIVLSQIIKSTFSIIWSPSCVNYMQFL